LGEYLSGIDPLQGAQPVTGFYDISSYKQTQDALRISEGRYQTVFDSTPIMFWLKDTENRNLRINRAAAEFEGVKPEMVEGKSCYDIYPREQAEAFYQDDLEVIRSGVPKRAL
jgi:PAS domain-containing protein